MRYLILSDSHGCAALTARAWREAGRVDGVLFAGDGLDDLAALAAAGAAVYAVRGNMDGLLRDAPLYRVETLAGVRVLLTHGHRAHVKQSLDDLAQCALERQAAVAVYGHTHVPRVERYRGVLTVNPGALRDGRYAVLTVAGPGECGAELMRMSAAQGDV